MQYLIDHPLMDFLGRVKFVFVKQFRIKKYS